MLSPTDDGEILKNREQVAVGRQKIDPVVKMLILKILLLYVNKKRYLVVSLYVSILMWILRFLSY